MLASQAPPTNLRRARTKRHARSKNIVTSSVIGDMPHARAVIFSYEVLGALGPDLAMALVADMSAVSLSPSFDLAQSPQALLARRSSFGSPRSPHSGAMAIGGPAGSDRAVPARHRRGHPPPPRRGLTPSPRRSLHAFACAQGNLRWKTGRPLRGRRRGMTIRRDEWAALVRSDGWGSLPRRSQVGAWAAGAQHPVLSSHPQAGTRRSDPDGPQAEAVPVPQALAHHALSRFSVDVPPWPTRPTQTLSSPSRLQRKRSIAEVRVGLNDVCYYLGYHASSRGLLTLGLGNGGGRLA